MARHRFFLTSAYDGERLSLTADDIHHLRDVLRLHPGEIIVAVEPGGRELQVRLTEVGEDVLGEVIGEIPRAEEPHVVLIQGLPKGPKTDEIVQRAVEIGIERILPVITERTVVKLDSAKAEDRAARWRKIAREAAKQSQRAQVPDVAAPVALRDAEAALRDLDHVLVAWEEAGEARGVGETLSELGATTASHVGVVVGPEGGLTADEVEWLCTLGAVVVSLGRTILRTETAGVVAAALATYELGGLGGEPRG